MLSYITWTVHPALFSIFGREIRWYSLMFAFGFWIGYKIVERMFKKDGVPENWLDSLFLYVFAGTVIGARLGHCLFYDPGYYLAHPIDILKVWEGGLASHGGAIGIIIAVLIYSRRVTHRNPLWTFDRLVVPVALVGAMIRIGNLMNHEIYGFPTDLPWGFRFITNLPQWEAGAAPIFSVPSHPTQIYESLFYLFTFIVLMYMYWVKKAYLKQGLIFGTFLLGIFGSRIFMEMLKNNQEAFEDAMTLNMGQLLSIPFVILGVYLVVRALRHHSGK